LGLKISQADERSKQLGIDLATAKTELASKQTELAEEQRKTAEAQEEAAKAQLELNKAFSLYVRRGGHRVLKTDELTKLLVGRSKRNVGIWYKPDNDEVRRFADDAYLAFHNSGWPVSMRQYKDNESLGGITLGNVKGVMLASPNPADVVGLDSFLMIVLRAQLMGGAGTSTTAPELPADTIVIVIGPEVGL
jgi:hypothetical protein